MRRGEYTSPALDRAVHPLDLRGVLSIVSAMAADGDYEGALVVARQATGTSGLVRAHSMHLYWMLFGAERMLCTLASAKQRRARRRAHLAVVR